MGMNIGGAGADANEPEILLEMNTTPLIDVMLVLIIMFIITVPAQLHAVRLDTPSAVPAAQQKTPVAITVAIAGDGTVRWNGDPLAGRAALHDRLEQAARSTDAPELQLLPAADAPYGAVAMVLSQAQRLGLTQLGMVGNERFAR